MLSTNAPAAIAGEARPWMFRAFLDAVVMIGGDSVSTVKNYLS